MKKNKIGRRENEIRRRKYHLEALGSRKSSLRDQNMKKTEVRRFGADSSMNQSSSGMLAWHKTEPTQIKS